MKRLLSSQGVTLSYDTYGSGPPLVLVHGSFSDHDTNWTFVKPILRERFTVCAVARRGRGQTDATKGHSLNDETLDVVEVTQEINEPVFLLGHSYGAHCSLGAAALGSELVRKLVLVWPNVISREALAGLEELAAGGQWDAYALTFFRDSLFVPAEDLEALRTTELWPPIISDARASLGDLRALVVLRGQAHEAMTTAPELYAESVTKFLPK